MEFHSAIDELDIGLSAAEKNALFQICDINQDQTVRLEEFFEFLKFYEISATESPTLDKSGSKFVRSATKRRTTVSNTKLMKGRTVGLQSDLQKAREEFDKFMKKIDIKPDHFFNNTKTILNDQMRCLKR
jgi:hypothetical protein